MREAADIAGGIAAPARPIAAWRRTLLFVLVALALYAAAYAIAEALVRQHGLRNRFFMINAAAPTSFDYVILGASRAMPLDFEDMNATLERESGARVINLAVEGAGVLPNRLMLDYFLTRHRTRNVVYVVDSFAFQSAQWNEQRLADAKLLQRAPFDPALALTLWRHRWARALILDYVSGFSKINNRNRCEPDVSDAERNLFRRSYRPVAFLDRQRMAYLYPGKPDPAAVARYLEALGALVRQAKAHGAKVMLVKPPLPARVQAMIPGEATFDAALKPLLEAEGVALHDLSRAVTRDAMFYNTDHLNRDGTLAFVKGQLAPLMAAERR